MAPSLYESMALSEPPYVPMAVRAAPTIATVSTSSMSVPLQNRVLPVPGRQDHPMSPERPGLDRHSRYLTRPAKVAREWDSGSPEVPLHSRGFLDEMGPAHLDFALAAVKDVAAADSPHGRVERVGAGELP